jgi:acetylornithine deacetylase
MAAVVGGRVEAREVLHTPAVLLKSFPGIENTVVSFTTDIPVFAGSWGEPFLFGPGSIHVAHTAEERISKQELLHAVDAYARMTTKLVGEV